MFQVTVQLLGHSGEQTSNVTSLTGQILLWGKTIKQAITQT